MITTLTLNPAIDKTLILENLVVNGINRVKHVNIEAGGKGINASKVIKALGHDTIAVGILGGSTGDKIMSMLCDKGIFYDFVKIKENSRINTKIVDIVNNTCTDINENGPFIKKQTLDELMIKIKYHAKESEIFIISGNAHESIPSNIYKDIIENIKNDTKVILDSSGNLLKEGIKAKPWMIKPNIDELKELIHKEISTLDELIFWSKEIVKAGITYVCVSLGKDGLLMVSEDKICLATPPEVISKSTVGAGDSVVGSLAVSFTTREDFIEATRKACAIGTAAVTLEGTGVPEKEIIDNFYKLIKIKNF